MIFFYGVSQQRKNATDEFVLKKLKSHRHHYGALSGGRGGFTLRYTTFDEIPKDSAYSEGKILHPERIRENVEKIIHSYNFILVVERMEESLVAMAMVMGIEVGDVLTTSSKVAGSTFHFLRNPPRCVALAKSFKSPAVRQHLESDEWHHRNYGDYLLHAAANLSLDKTIARLGAGAFQEKLKEFRRLRALEQQICAPHVQFPCSNEGKPQLKVSSKTCYIQYNDFGCGHKCHDKLILNMTRSSKIIS